MRRLSSCIFFTFFTFCLFVFLVLLVLLSFLYFYLFVIFVFLSFYFIFLFIFLSFFVFLSFCHHYHNHGSISTTTQICVPIRQFFQFYHTFYHTFYHKPLPVLLSTPPPPPRHFLYLRETQANVLRGLQRFWGGCKDFGNNLGMEE